MKVRKLHRFILICTLAILILPGIMLALPVPQAWSSPSPGIVDIETDPTDILFDLSNLKPGDSCERILIVKNVGKKDFTYNLKSSYVSGSREFYDQLKLLVRDTTSVLYAGKLSGFTGVPARFLASPNQESLTFTMVFPPESDNQFQGKAVNFLFDFYAEETIGQSNWDKSSLSFIDQGGNSKEIYAVIKNGEGSETMQGPVIYQVYWIASGNPKNGKVVGTGTLNPLQPGATQKLTYNPQGISGVYMFKSYQRPGHPASSELWSDEIRVPSIK